MESPTEVPVLVKNSLRSYDIDSQDLPVLSDTEFDKKELEIENEILPSADLATNLDDFPDGGVRAWAVSFGVRLLQCARPVNNY